MKNVINWLVVAAVGLGFMLLSHFAYEHEAGPEEWRYAFMYVGTGDPNPEAEEFEYTKRPVRLLDLSGRVKNFAQMAKGFGPDVNKTYRIASQEKLILYPELAADFSEQMLVSGKLPASGSDEALAGYCASAENEITINGRTLKVVGRLKKTVSVFANCYLIGKGTAAEKLFRPGDKAVRSAFIFRLPRDQLKDSQVREQLEKAFPKSQFTVYAPIIRTQQAAFLIYMAGMALLLVGGTLAFFKLYCTLADRIKNKWLRLPLMEIRRYGRLFIAVNLLYFGTVVVFMLIVRSVPEFQFCLLTTTKAQVASGSGPLGIAGKAYLSKNIPLAALVTLGINFPLGSLLCLTLPSIIIPGSGALLAGFRAMLWGLLLSPSFSSMSGPMIPHNVTLLLEGHAYVIATFFGILVPVYLFRKAEGPNVGIRYVRALLMNVRGNLLVLIVLAVAAVYEAVEVILLMMALGG